MYHNKLYSSFILFLVKKYVLTYLISKSHVKPVALVHFVPLLAYKMVWNDEWIHIGVDVASCITVQCNNVNLLLSNKG